MNDAESIGESLVARMRAPIKMLARRKTGNPSANDGKGSVSPNNVTLLAGLVVICLALTGCGDQAAKDKGKNGGPETADTALGTGETEKATVVVPKVPYSPMPNAKSIDDFVFGRLKQLDIRPALACSDGVFCHRLYIDLLGTVPTADEAAAFLADRKSDKRSRLIDRLLKREEYADYWAMKWGDLLRIKAEFPINLWPNAAQAYTRWVRSSIVENKPYDKFAREMLTSSGSNFRVGQVNFYRAMQNRTSEGIAHTVALTLMGTRAEKWPAEKLASFSACFAEVGYKPTREWKEQIVYWDPEKPKKEAKAAMAARTDALAEFKPVPTLDNAVLPDGSKLQMKANLDPREAFANWLLTPGNRWFSRCIVNRVWAWLMGRGIVHEFDDIRPDNPPSNPGLLAYLERELATHGYDLQHLYRLILNSRAYQLSAQGTAATPVALANFASYPMRRLEAEVLIDSINKLTGTYDLYTSAIPEPFTYIPKDIPAVALADGSITSSFLALFGRSARATGQAEERNSKILAGQWLHLLNSTHIHEKIERGAGLRSIRDSKQSDRKTLERLYLTVLSRLPTPEEAQIALAYSVSGSNSVEASRQRWTDLTWALINSHEFLFRH